jgi:hypothetical protein
MCREAGAHSTTPTYTTGKDSPAREPSGELVGVILLHRCVCTPVYVFVCVYTYIFVGRFFCVFPPALEAKFDPNLLARELWNSGKHQG